MSITEEKNAAIAGSIDDLLRRMSADDKEERSRKAKAQSEADERERATDARIEEVREDSRRKSENAVTLAEEERARLAYAEAYRQKLLAQRAAEEALRQAEEETASEAPAEAKETTEVPAEEVRPAALQPEETLQEAEQTEEAAEFPQEAEQAEETVEFPQEVEQTEETPREPEQTAEETQETPEQAQDCAPILLDLGAIFAPTPTEEEPVVSEPPASAEESAPEPAHHETLTPDLQPFFALHPSVPVEPLPDLPHENYVGSFPDFSENEPTRVKNTAPEEEIPTEDGTLAIGGETPLSDDESFVDLYPVESSLLSDGLVSDELTLYADAPLSEETALAAPDSPTLVAPILYEREAETTEKLSSLPVAEDEEAIAAFESHLEKAEKAGAGLPVEAEPLPAMTAKEADALLQREADERAINLYDRHLAETDKAEAGGSTRRGTKEYLPVVVETYGNPDDILSPDARHIGKRELSRYLSDHAKRERKLARSRVSYHSPKLRRSIGDAVILLVDRLGAERKIAASRIECLVAARTVGNRRHVARAEKRLEDAIGDYNLTVDRYRDVTGRTLTKLSPAIPSLILAGRGFPDLPLVEYRIETPTPRGKGNRRDKKAERARRDRLSATLVKDRTALDRLIARLHANSPEPQAGVSRLRGRKMRAAACMKTDLSTVISAFDYEVARLETDRDLSRYRFEINERRKKDELSRKASLVRKSGKEAPRVEKYERSLNIRAFAAACVDPAAIAVRKSADRARIAELREKIAALLEERDSVDRELSSLYGQDRERYGSALSRKMRKVELRAAKHAYNENRANARHVRTLPVSSSEKETMLGLLNEKISLRSGIAKIDFRIRKAGFRGRVKKAAKAEARRLRGEYRKVSRRFGRLYEEGRKRDAAKRRDRRALVLLILFVILLLAALAVLLFREQIGAFLTPVGEFFSGIFQPKGGA